MKWEYMETYLRLGSIVDAANEKGQDGWELCSVLPKDSGFLLIYKRLIPEHP